MTLFYNIFIKIKYNFYISSGSAGGPPPPPPRARRGAAPPADPEDI
jgi:hypothetical protein